MVDRWGKNGNSDIFIFLDFKITADGDCSHEIKRHFLLGRKFVTNLDRVLKSWDITLPTKVYQVKVVVFPVVMYGCESWTIKKAECWRIDAFEASIVGEASVVEEVFQKTLESPLDSKEIKLVRTSTLKFLIGRTGAEAPILWLPDAKSQITGKDPDAGKDWGQKKGVTEDEMVR